MLSPKPKVTAQQARVIFIGRPSKTLSGGHENAQEEADIFYWVSNLLGAQ